MEYIVQTGRQLKIRMKEHKADSKWYFSEKVEQKEKRQIIWHFRTFEGEKTSIRLEFD